MSRLTGREVANLIEAYSAVYAPQEEVVQESVEQIDEAPQVVPAAAKVNQQTTTPKKGESAADARTRADAIEFTRRGGLFGQAARTLTRGFGSNKDIASVDAADKASQARINQRVAASQGKYYSSSDGKTYANYNDAVAARNSRLAANKPKPGDDKGTGTGTGTGSGSGANVISAKNIAGQQQKVTVGRGYEATLGGQKGKVTYDAAGKRTFAADKPAAAKPAPTPADKPVATGTLGSTSFERRTPTSTELKAAQGARETGASPEKALQAAKIAGAGEKAASTSTTNQTPRASSTPQITPTPKINIPNDLGSKPMSGASGFGIKPLNTAGATAATTKSVAPEVKVTNTAAANSNTGKTELKPLKQDLDLFDIVKGHLLDEGYAETEEAALKIMANMGEAWKKEILDEAKYGTAAGRKALAKKIRKGENIGKKGPGTGFKAVEKAAKEGGAEDPTAVAAAAMWKTHGKGKKG